MILQLQLIAPVKLDAVFRNPEPIPVKYQSSSIRVLCATYCSATYRVECI